MNYAALSLVHGNLQRGNNMTIKVERHLDSMPGKMNDHYIPHFYRKESKMES